MARDDRHRQAIPGPGRTRAPDHRLTTFDRRSTGGLSPTGEQRVHDAVVQAFAPFDKAALGAAMGLVVGALGALVTVADLLLDVQGRAELHLLSQYFYGYTVSPRGALVALGWGLLVGFVAGWFLAFVRNAVMAAWLLYFRARAEWHATHDLLDYV